MMIIITRDFGYVPVELRGDRGVLTHELTAFCFEWIRLVGVIQTYLERIM